MNDRLEEIKQHIADIPPSIPALMGHIEWLIEQLRLKEKIIKMYNADREANK